MNLKRQVCLLYIAVIFLLMSQYVVNSYPYDRIFRLLGLLTLVGVIIVVIAGRFSGRRNTP